jgi:hypothetical protein
MDRPSLSGGCLWSWSTKVGGSKASIKERHKTHDDHVRRRLSFSLAWTFSGNRRVGSSYALLLDKSRCIAGREMARAWETTPICGDDGMNIADIDLSALKEYEKGYLCAAQDLSSPSTRFTLRLRYLLCTLLLSIE